jgi:hypothetical protein
MKIGGGVQAIEKLFHFDFLPWANSGPTYPWVPKINLNDFKNIFREQMGAKIQCHPGAAASLMLEFSAWLAGSIPHCLALKWDFWGHLGSIIMGGTGEGHLGGPTKSFPLPFRYPKRMQKVA